MSYRSEINRCIDRIELREELRLDYDITDEEYRSEHSVEGMMRTVLGPDREVIRSRKHPPSNPIQAVVQQGASEESFGDGYPGAELIAAVTRVPPTTQRDQQFQEGFKEVEFTVDGIPENGTVTLDGDWELSHAQDSLAEDERKVVSHEYDIEEFPSDQLPIVIHGHLRRDAREYRENRPSTVQEQELVERQYDSWDSYLQQFEGQAVFALEVEYRQDSPERNIAAGDGQLSIKNFRMEMESTFPNIEFRPRENSTYNREEKQVEWRERNCPPGKSLLYEVYGGMEQLLDLGRISASIRGVIGGATLTGTKIRGVYDRTGRDLVNGGQVRPGHGVLVTGDVEVDPMALRSEDRKVMDASVSLNDTPFDAFDRLQRVCEREGMTIRGAQPPSNPEPVANREGVLAITKGQKDDAEDQPGELKIKREYGDEGVVYANMVVYGEWTSISRDREVSQSSGMSDATEDSLVRADQGALGDRGKSTVDIRARSRDSELNSRLVRTIQDEITGDRV